MHVTAKFKVESVTEYTYGKHVKLHPVVSGSDENTSWSKYTPSGSLEMTITNPAAYDQFKVGAEVYLTFTDKLEAAAS